MTERVLFVDDEPRILDGIRRTLRNTYDVELAEGGAKGLEALQDQEFAVIVSDMMMPEINGPRFLAEAAKVQPEAVQIILSGQADLDSTVEAVNAGRVFRFLLKPVDRQALSRSLDAALENFRLRQVERDLLQDTVGGAVDALGEILSMANPQATRRASVVHRLVRQMADGLDRRNDWQLRVIGQLANIGCAAVPVDVLERAASGAELSDQERAMVARHPEIAAEVIGRIPRLEGVAEVVRLQNASSLDGAPDGLDEHVAILQLATDVADRVLRGIATMEAVALAAQARPYPERLLSCLGPRPDATLVEVDVSELRLTMTLWNDLRTTGGACVANAGTELTPAVLEQIRNFAAGVGVREPIIVALPDGT
ncbi:MAG: response regulator [Actinomycetota bacterium]